MARTTRRSLTTRSLGSRAELQAADFLRREGLTPVAQNVRFRRGEIDLVMLDRDCLVFVEVRRRNQNSFVDATLTIDRRKQKKLIDAASAFLAARPHYGEHVCRFDVVGVDVDGRGRSKLQWIRDAFRPAG